MRYFYNQKDQFRCGPVALLNLAKSIGMPTTYKRVLPVLSKVCKCTYPKGTMWRYFECGLRLLFKKHNNIKTIERIQYPSIKDIDKALTLNHKIILNYVTDIPTRHFVYLFKTSKYYYAANDCRDREITKLTRKELKQRINTTDAAIWIIKLSNKKQKIDKLWYNITKR